MKTVYFSLLLAFFVLPLLAQEQTDPAIEKQAIEQVVINAYQEGISNKGDVQAIEKGFHPCFNIIGLGQNNGIWHYPIYSWIESVEQKQKEGKYPAEEKVTFKLPLVDVTGNAAIAKVHYFKSEKHIYTDYLSLYKFAEGWRIVNKIYFQLEKN